MTLLNKDENEESGEEEDGDEDGDDDDLMSMRLREMKWRGDNMLDRCMRMWEKRRYNPITSYSLVDYLLPPDPTTMEWASSDKTYEMIE